MLTDIEIATRAKLVPIAEIAKNLGITEEELEPYGRFKAKLNDELFERLKDKPDGKLILVTAINPTPAGEGKTTTTAGLGQAMAKIGSYVDGMTYRVPQTLINNFRNRYASNNGDGEVSCQDGWCYIAHDVKTTGGDGEMNGTYYSVVTFVNIDIPVINNLIGLGDFLSVSGETRTIYR